MRWYVISGGGEKPLVEPHVIPEFLYRPLYDDKHRAIEAKLGHRSPSVTRRYIGITYEDISAVEERVELYVRKATFG